jgi:hypothetical protein
MKATDLPRAIDLAEHGRIELGALVSERYGLTEGARRSQPEREADVEGGRRAAAGAA